MTDIVDDLVAREYAFGFHSDIDTDFAPKGLTEDVVTGLSFCLALLAWIILLLALCSFIGRRLRHMSETPIHECDEYRKAVRKVQGR